MKKNNKLKFIPLFICALTSCNVSVTTSDENSTSSLDSTLTNTKDTTETTETTTIESNSDLTSSSTSNATSSEDYTFEYNDVRVNYELDSEGYISYKKNAFKNKSIEDYYDSILNKQGKELKEELYYLIRGHDRIEYDASYIDNIYKEIDGNNNSNHTMNYIYSGVLDNSYAYDKEHVWPKSYGFNDYKDQDAGCDLHNLHPSLGNVNSLRNDLLFMELEENHKNIKNNYYDFVIGYKDEEKLFMPRNESKGDVARTLLYMAVRYEGKEKIDGVKLDSPDLEINNGYIYLKDENINYIGNIETLLKWNMEDKVSKNEVNRNNLIYEKYQHNRNPFIDYPILAELIFNKDCKPYKLELSNNTTHLFDNLKEDEYRGAPNINLNVKDKYVFTDKTKTTGIENSYIKNIHKIFKTNEKDFKMSCGLKSNSITIGNYDKIKVEIEQKYLDALDNYKDSSHTSSSLAMEFDANNIKAFSLYVAEYIPCLYPNFEKDFAGYHVLFSSDNGKSYKVLKSGDLSSIKNYQISYEFEKEVHGRISFVFEGKYPRMNVTKLVLY